MTLVVYIHANVACNNVMGCRDVSSAEESLLKELEGLKEELNTPEPPCPEA
jgi:dihydroorotate dehydrogenase